MKEILDFYLRLSQNNNKPWFDEHRPEYEATKKKLHAIAEEFIMGVEDFDPRCKGLQVKDCTYRINRDIRFSQDKHPYKNWHGIYVCPKGKKSGMAGYYIHFEPINDLYFVCGGLYNPTKEVLQSVREQIMLEPDAFHEAVLGKENAFKLIGDEWMLVTAGTEDKFNTMTASWGGVGILEEKDNLYDSFKYPYEEGINWAYDNYEE